MGLLQVLMKMDLLLWNNKPDAIITVGIALAKRQCVI